MSFHNNMKFHPSMLKFRDGEQFTVREHNYEIFIAPHTGPKGNNMPRLFNIFNSKDDNLFAEGILLPKSQLFRFCDIPQWYWQFHHTEEEVPVSLMRDFYPLFDEKQIVKLIWFEIHQYTE